MTPTSNREAPLSAGAGAIGAQQARDASARLFRSVKAGRAWVRARGTPATAQDPVCVLMKPGNHEPPLFIVPGAPGSILQLGGVATALPMPAAVYAIKPRGLEDGEAPYETLAEMAAYAVDAMRRVRPNGPYYLAGYSAGGLVALEMAQQLSAAGLEVAVLVLIDTYPGWRFWPLRYHADALLRRALKAASLARSGSPPQAIRELGSAILGFARQIGLSGRRVQPLPPVAEGWSAASRRVHLATFAACEAYRPQRYAGRVAFIQPAELENAAPRRPPDLWRTYLSKVEGYVVPTSHLGLVETAAEATAAQIGKCLAQAERLMQSSVAAAHHPQRHPLPTSELSRGSVECL